jgi:chorismate mutase
MTKNLDDLRNEIDKADEELLHALSKRFSIVREIGKLKKEKNIPALDEKRWNEVLKKIIEKTEEHNLPKDLITKIYNEIHNAALTIEKDHE